jgi:hypothetical protein
MLKRMLGRLTIGGRLNFVELGFAFAAIKVYAYQRLPRIEISRRQSGKGAALGACSVIQH